MDTILAISPELTLHKASADSDKRGVDEEECRQVLARENVGRATAEAAGELLRHLQALADAGLVDAHHDDLLCDLLGRVRTVLHVESLAVLLSTDDGRAFGVRSALDDELAAGAQVPIHWGVVGRVMGRRQAIAICACSRQIVIRSGIIVARPSGPVGSARPAGINAAFAAAVLTIARARSCEFLLFDSSVSGTFEIKRSIA